MQWPTLGNLIGPWFPIPALAQSGSSGLAHWVHRDWIPTKVLGSIGPIKGNQESPPQIMAPKLAKHRHYSKLCLASLAARLAKPNLL